MRIVRQPTEAVGSRGQLFQHPWGFVAFQAPLHFGDRWSILGRSLRFRLVKRGLDVRLCQELQRRTPGAFFHPTGPQPWIGVLAELLDVSVRPLAEITCASLTWRLLTIFHEACSLFDVIDMIVSRCFLKPLFDKIFFAIVIDLCMYTKSILLQKNAISQWPQREEGEGNMRLDVKLAILKSGKPQYAIAQDLGIPEPKLSKYVHGYGTLRPEEVRKLSALLGLDEEPSDVAFGRDTPETSR
jgi:hypothetical protein